MTTTHAAQLRERLLVVASARWSERDDAPPSLLRAQSAPTTLSVPIVADPADVSPICGDCDVPDEACTICLGTSSETDKRMLGCGHIFCASCIRTHITTQLRQRRSVCCPNCKRAVQGGVLASNVSLGLLHSPAATTAAEEPTPANTELTAAARREKRRMQRRFEATARREHLKRCPSCSAPIAKTGGCDRMRCHCGHSFSWSRAQTVVPCNQLHKSGIWFNTCAGCTCGASSKRMMANTGVSFAMVPAAAGAAGLAASVAALCLTVSLVPAVVCGPLAVVYEPVRWLKKCRTPGQRHKNPFAIASGAGMILPALVLWQLCADDDD